MLANAINEFKTGMVYPDGYPHDRCMDGLKRRLEEAGKFVLDSEASAMAANVALSKPSSILAALEFTHLPVDPMWIEFVNDDTRNAMKDLGSPNLRPDSGITKIERSGFLLMRNDDDLIIEYAHTDRVQDGRTMTDIAPVRARFSMKGFGKFDRAAMAMFAKVAAKTEGTSGKVKQHLATLNADPEERAADDEIRLRFSHSPHLDVAPVRKNLLKMVGEEKTLAIEEAQATEMFRLFALQVLPALILLNCKNAVDRVVVAAPEKLNKARVKKGKKPIPEHVMVKVHLSPSKQRRYESSGGTAAAARGGLVVGHFKVRRSGIYWWSPHWRGSMDQSGPSKTFVLTR